MYRFLALLVLFNFALSHFHHDFDSGSSESCEFDDSGPGSHEHHHGPGSHEHGPGDHNGPGSHGPPQESDFDKLARYVISADKKVIKSCKQSPYSRVRVLPGADLYSLKYNLPEFTESGIKVQIKHRVISTTAEAQGVTPFKDLRIIPDIVNAAGASWFFDNTTLTVLMPYKNPLQTEVALNCTGDVNESVIDVSKTTNSNDDLRSLDNNA